MTFDSKSYSVFRVPEPPDTKKTHIEEIDRYYQSVNNFEDIKRI